MNAKDMIIDFINDIFAIILIGLCIMFFIIGDRFEAFGQFMKALFPLAVFVIIFLVKFRINRMQLKKRENENNPEIVLRITYVDKLIFDVLIYLLPIIIVGIAFIANKQITLVDIFQAIAAFLIMYFWQRILFKKEG